MNTKLMILTIIKLYPNCLIVYDFHVDHNNTINCYSHDCAINKINYTVY
jgi:hypothetical protein